MYSIGEISKMFDLPISTLRYYDKEGLFPHLKRVNGVRKFSENEIETLRVIDCLKRSGLEIKDIKEYMNLCSLGIIYTWIAISRNRRSITRNGKTSKSTFNA